MSNPMQGEALKRWSVFANASSDVLSTLIGCSNKKEAIKAIPDATVVRMGHSWLERATDAQIHPLPDNWKTWLFLGGRGAGKTRAGAEWLHGQALPGARPALVGATLNDVREVMIEGPSGLLNTGPDDKRPRYESSRRRLKWRNGALAYAFSAEEPERLRGPQFDAAWCDEFCAWPHLGETLALLRLGLRRGSDPRLVITTTPRPSPALRALMAEPGVVTSRARTADNAHNLAPDFLATVDALYGGTRRAAQELDGVVVEAAEGALWRVEDFARLRCPVPDRFDRIVVAVDPPVSAHGDACGIIAAGRVDDRAVVLDDATVGGLSSLGWAQRAVAAARRWNAGSIVAEANQGGEMVRTVLNMAGCPVPIVLVHAKASKRLRAEPVAALYEQGRVRHAGVFGALEEEMMALGVEGDGGLKHSPDRADALVWAVTNLLLTERVAPRVRGL